MRITLIVNPHAGRGRGRALLPGVVSQIAATVPGAELHVQQVQGFDDAVGHIEQARDEARPWVEGEPLDAVLVMGGDGMLTLGVNALADSGVVLGMVPAGTGNDMCRGYGTPHAQPEAAVRMLERGRTRLVDTLRVSPVGPSTERPHHVGSVVCSGFDAIVNRRANAMTLPIGSLRYAASVFAEISAFSTIGYDLTVDGERLRFEAMLAAIGNGSYFGGGLMVCPDADPADGWMDVTVVGDVTRAELVALLPLMWSRAFLRHPRVRTFRAREIVVNNPLGLMGDGEELLTGPARVAVDPESLRILVPS